MRKQALKGDRTELKGSETGAQAKHEDTLDKEHAEDRTPQQKCVGGGAKHNYFKSWNGKRQFHGSGRILR